jgi:hypothetical protein
VTAVTLFCFFFFDFFFDSFTAPVWTVGTIIVDDRGMDPGTVFGFVKNATDRSEETL